MSTVQSFTDLTMKHCYLIEVAFTVKLESVTALLGLKNDALLVCFSKFHPSSFFSVPERINSVAFRSIDNNLKCPFSSHFSV